VSTWSVTSDWRSRTKAQLLEDVYALIEMRDRQIERADRNAERAKAAEERAEQAEMVARSMDHFAEVAEVCERKSNAYAARLARVEALIAVCADSGCIHLNDMYASLRAALDTAGHGDPPGARSGLTGRCGSEA
jgi:hypothetical protein